MIQDTMYKEDRYMTRLDFETMRDVKLTRNSGWVFINLTRALCEPGESHHNWRLSVHLQKSITSFLEA